MPRIRLTLPTLLAFAAGACSSSSEEALAACTLLAEPAVEITLRDATTSAPIAGAILILSESDPAFSEQMRENEPGIFVGGFERPGTYDVAITATGYVARTVQGIVAPAGPCGPETQRRVVELQPAPTDALLLLLGPEVRMVSGKLLVDPHR